MNRNPIRFIALVLLAVVLSVPSATAQQEQEPPDDIGGADIVHGDDVIVEGSLCASFDNACASGESFFVSGVDFSASVKIRDSVPFLHFEDNGADPDWSIGNTENDPNFHVTNDVGAVKITVEQDTPDNVLQLLGNGVLLNNAGAAGSVVEVLRLRSNVPPQQVFKNTGTGAAWSFSMAANDQFIVSRRGTPGVEARFYPNGDLRMRGNVRAQSFIQTSDANLKTAFSPVDTAAVLDAVAALPITEWSFLTDGEGVRHVGPTAQDFAAAFDLGQTRTGIASVDADGVALAAIQALEAENDELRADIAELRAMVDALAAD